jgi:hypothetical protein
MKQQFDAVAGTAAEVEHRSGADKRDGSEQIARGARALALEFHIEIGAPASIAVIGRHAAVAQLLRAEPYASRFAVKSPAQ